MQPRLSVAMSACNKAIEKGKSSGNSEYVIMPSILRRK